MEAFWNRAARDKDRIRYQQASSYSPYSEFFGEWMEEKQGVTYLTFNAFYRFDGIMEALFEKTELKIAHRDFLFDLYAHFLIELEFKSGLTKREFDVHDMMEAIINGEYGKTVARQYRLLDEKEKYYVAHELFSQEKTGASIERFVSVLTTLLGNSITYKNKFKVKELLLYVGNKENKNDQERIEMTKELFQPLGYSLNVFWETHFSVLDEKQTMEIGEIELL